MDQRTLMTAPAPTVAARTTSSSSVADSAKPFRGKRITREELYEMRPDLRPADDDDVKQGGSKRVRHTPDSAPLPVRMSPQRADLTHKRLGS